MSHLGPVGCGADADNQSGDIAPTPSPRRVVKRIVGRQVPDSILQNQALNDAIAILPLNYNFEIHKTVWRIRQAGARRVALQFPEGLLLYACVISDILESFAGVDQTFIMGDVTFGACCVDDYSADALGADFLVHYGHSCLVPVDVTNMPCMYVFVDIKMDVDHLIHSVRRTLQPHNQNRIILAGTIQFAASLHEARTALESDGYSVTVPQSKPLSPGEVLGCTAPHVPGEHDALVFVADGRFHLEALMIANPEVRAYRYDPYGRILTEEEYDQSGMRAARQAAIETARHAARWGLVLGTLGRQGNPRILSQIQQILEKLGKQYVTVLLSEVTPAKLSALSSGCGSGGGGGIEAWVQIACPRLSIDWGEEFTKPTLNPYEAFVALGECPPWWEEEGGQMDYPMDYYASDGGVYNSTYHRPKPKSRASASSMVGRRTLLDPAPPE